MRAKEYLSQIHLLDKRINNRIQELKNIKDQISVVRPVRYDKDHVQHSDISDCVSDGVARYIDTEREINAMIDELVALKHKVTGEIERLNDPRHVELLFLRYVQCMTFEQIAVSMDYSFRQVLRLHGSALQEFDQTILS